jgi:glycerophosphoryl diester phosphodiesterase
MTWSQPRENSVDSLAEGIDRFDGVELDLRLTCDGELVLHHDRELAVPGITQFVEDCTLDEVKSHGFDSFDDLISSREFLKSWTEEAKFVCLELKIPHPASKAGGGWMNAKKRVTHLQTIMEKTIEKISSVGIDPQNTVFYSFHSKVNQVNKKIGGDWNASSLRPVVPPYGSALVQKLISLPQFVFNPLSRLIRRQRNSGSNLLPIAIEYLEGWTRHLPLGRAGSLQGKGLQRFNQLRKELPVVVWQVEERHEEILLNAGMSPLTDDADPSTEIRKDGIKRKFRPATMSDSKTPWHELNNSERRELISKWRKKWSWQTSLDELSNHSSSTSLPWQSTRMLGHRGCGKN